MQWNEHIVFTFLKKIRSHPCLWNPSDKNRKNRNMVHGAFKSISEEMGIDNIDELKKKKENLFQTYRNYRRKVNRRSQHYRTEFNDTYKPTWPPFSILDDFLHEIYTPKVKYGQYDPLDISDRNEELKNSDYEEANSVSSDHDTLHFSGNEAENLPSTNTLDKDMLTGRPGIQRNFKRSREGEGQEDVEFMELIPIKDEINGSVSCLDRDDEFLLLDKDAPAQRPPIQSNAKRLRKGGDQKDMEFMELVPIKDQVNESASCVGRDECTIYGELIAIKLRKMDERTRQLAMHRIDNIMFDIAFNPSVLPS